MWEDNRLLDLVVGCGLDSSGSGQRPVACTCGHCHRFSYSTKDENIFLPAERLLASQERLCSIQ
jgi:hypothetical protein